MDLGIFTEFRGYSVWVFVTSKVSNFSENLDFLKGINNLGFTVIGMT